MFKKHSFAEKYKDAFKTQNINIFLLSRTFANALLQQSYNKSGPYEASSPKY